MTCLGRAKLKDLRTAQLVHLHPHHGLFNCVIAQLAPPPSSEYLPSALTADPGPPVAPRFHHLISVSQATMVLLLLR